MSRKTPGLWHHGTGGVRKVASPSAFRKIAAGGELRALGRVDIYRSQIMAPTRNSMDANESAVFS
jgi:hypothetical protein